MSSQEKWMMEDLQKSGLTPQTIEEMGVRVVKGRDDLKNILGFSSLQNPENLEENKNLSILQCCDAYEIPYLFAKNKYSRVKLSTEIEGARYLSPKRKGEVHLYALPGEQEKLKSVKYPLWITEGEKKAAKLTQELRKHMPSQTCVGLAGVTMWENCEEWPQVPLALRHVTIVFDSDWETNPEVQYQLVKLFLFLKKRKANPFVATFDKGKGIDDHLLTFQENELQQELERIWENASAENIWNTNLNHYKLADAMASQYFSIEEDARAIWSEYKLGDVYPVSWTNFKGLLKKAYAQISRNRLPETSKRIIKIEGGKVHENILAAEEALIQDNTIYQRDGFLVRVVPDGHEKLVKRPESAKIIQQVGANYLVKLLTEKAEFIKYNKQENKWEKVDCPKTIPEILMESNPWRLPFLEGIITAPTMRKDGSILDKPGYDNITGLLYIPEQEFPPIPENPTLEDAQSACSKITKILSEFPFTDKQSQSVIIAAILTALVRKSIRTAPLFAISAPKMGSGKSLLANIISMIATGHDASMLSQAKTSEEEKKRLLAVLMEGDQVVCIDNVEHPLMSDSLCTILTEERWKDRLLGQTKTVNVSTASTFIATGNNLQIKGDLSTRALLCQIDANCENPEEREFKTDIRKYIATNRGNLVVAGLTMLKAYQLAGCPRQEVKEYGRFEEWNHLVRHAMIWLGLSDPCETRKKIAENDSTREALRILLENWHKAVTGAITVKTLSSLTHENAELKEALLVVAEGKTGEIDNKKLSYYLRCVRNRWENGLSIVQDGLGTGGFTKWKVLSNRKQAVGEHLNSSQLPSQAELFEETE